jgi:hypothetical protein
MHLKLGLLHLTVGYRIVPYSTYLSAHIITWNYRTYLGKLSKRKQRKRKESKKKPTNLTPVSGILLIYLAALDIYSQVSSQKLLLTFVLLSQYTIKYPVIRDC